MRTGRAVAAGLVGTAVMTVLLLIEPSVGLPKIAMGQIVSTSLGLASASLAIGPTLGWIIHFLVGVLLAVIYAAFFASRLPGSAVVRGLIYGGLVFLLAQLIFMPLAGIGFFSRGDLELIAGSLLGHLVYGGLTSWIYGGTTAVG
jgi:uncharacterized membrane protein YagU involved in acid resistance